MIIKNNINDFKIDVFVDLRVVKTLKWFHFIDV